MVDSQTGDVTLQVIKFNMNDLYSQSQRLKYSDKRRECVFTISRVAPHDKRERVSILTSSSFATALL